MADLTILFSTEFEAGVFWHTTEDHKWFLGVKGMLIEVSHAVSTGVYPSSPIHILDGDFMNVAKAMQALADLRQQTVYFRFREPMDVFPAHPTPS